MDRNHPFRMLTLLVTLLIISSFMRVVSQVGDLVLEMVEELDIWNRNIFFSLEILFPLFTSVDVFAGLRRDHCGEVGDGVNAGLSRT